jgi:hypothetical protein
MTDFKGRHFEGEIVLWAVRWYCRYGMCRATIRFAGPPTIILAGFAERGRTIWEAILA